MENIQEERNEQSIKIIIKQKLVDNLVMASQKSFDINELRIKTIRDDKDIIVNILDSKYCPHYLSISGVYQSVQHEYANNERNIQKGLETGQFSYVRDRNNTSNNNDILSICPRYNNEREIERTSRESIFASNEVTKNGELKCVDAQVIKSQSGVLLQILKSVTQSVLEGRGIVGVSLPIKIFQPLSTIERIVDWWSYCPQYLSTAHNLDPLGRFLNVIAFAFAGLHVSVSQQKPFNPLLGETYQAYFPQDHTQIFCEHLSHHPPITNFLLLNSQTHFTFQGSYEYQAQISKTLNNITFFQKGTSTVTFHDQQKISFNLPFIKIKGVLHGERTTNYNGLMTFIDQTNSIKAIIKIGGNSKKKGGFLGFGASQRLDIIKGKIYKYNKQYKTEIQSNQQYQNDQDWKMEDMVQELMDIEGSWFENLIIGGKEIWNIQKHKPSMHKSVQNPLPSDQRYREDLIWLKLQNQQNSEIWKKILEEKQRSDKKLRQDFKK